MWFKKKEPVKIDILKGAPPVLDARQEQIKEMKAWRDIGQKFNYLGVKCIVVSHYKIVPSGMLKIPLIEASYVDNLGVIHSITFGYSELKVLINQNGGVATPPKKKPKKPQ